jgi:hypothetical protein
MIRQIEMLNTQKKSADESLIREQERIAKSKSNRKETVAQKKRDSIHWSLTADDSGKILGQ